MPSDDSFPCSELLKFTGKPTNMLHWELAMVTHDFISKSSFEHLIAFLYLQFPLDGTCFDQSKDLYRRLFLIAHVLQKLSSITSMEDVVSQFVYLRKIYQCKSVPLERLLSAITLDNVIPTMEEPVKNTLIDMFNHIMHLFNVRGMQRLTAEFTFEKAVLSGLIEPPKLCIFSPWLATILGFSTTINCEIN